MPYFTLEEAARIKGTIVPVPILNEIPEFEAIELEEDPEYNASLKIPDVEDGSPKEMTVETAITLCFQSFF